MVRAGVMEKIMHKTSDATHECELNIDELDAVVGGRTDVIKVMGNAKWEDGGTYAIIGHFGGSRGRFQGGFALGLPPPALGERRHRSLARGLVASAARRMSQLWPVAHIQEQSCGAPTTTPSSSTSKSSWFHPIGARLN
jgi:hypothetical protein